MHDLTPFLAPPSILKDELERARHYLARQLAPATLRAYRADFNVFYAWCSAHGLEAKPATPETVALFLSQQATSGVSTITLGRRVTAIHWVHRQFGYASPTKHPVVEGMLAGVRREHGAAPRRQKEPLMDFHILRLQQLCPNTLPGLRDKALITLGFAGAFRRSELVNLRVEHLRFEGEHLEVTLPRSKTDQQGRGRSKPIYNGRRLQPVTLLREWLYEAAISEGYVFRPFSKTGRVLERGLSDRTVADLVKEYARQLQLNPALFAGHSLRSGFITSAGEHDESLYKIMEVSLHTDPRTVLIYLRRPNQFKEHAGRNFL